MSPDYDELLSGLAIEFAVTRTVRDAAALLDAVNGPGIGDKYEIASPARPYTEEVGTPAGQLRIALTSRAWSDVAVEQEHVQAVESVGRELLSLGHRVEEASLPLDWEAFVASQLPLWTTSLAGSAVGLAAVLGVELGPDVLEAVTLSCVEHGRRTTALDLLAAQRTGNFINRAVGAFFRDYDVLVTPTVATLFRLAAQLEQALPWASRRPRVVAAR